MEDLRGEKGVIISENTPRVEELVDAIKVTSCGFLLGRKGIIVCVMRGFQTL